MLRSVRLALAVLERKGSSGGVMVPVSTAEELASLSLPSTYSVMDWTTFLSSLSQVSFAFVSLRRMWRLMKGMDKVSFGEGRLASWSNAKAEEDMLLVEGVGSSASWRGEGNILACRRDPSQYAGVIDPLARRAVR